MDCGGGLRWVAGNCSNLNGLSLPKFRRRLKNFEELGRIYRKFTSDLQVTGNLLQAIAEWCRLLLDASGYCRLLLACSSKTDCWKFGDEFV